jgi:hypothetical protein
MNRFQHKIQKKMNVFNKYFRQVNIEKPSGVPYEEYIEHACTKYQEDLDEPFPFKDCVPILHQMPKFDPMIEVEEIVIEDNEDDPSSTMSTASGDRKPAAVNRVGAPMGAGKPRPIGSKAAKRVAKEEQSISSVETSKVEALRSLAGTSLEIVTAIKRHNDLQEAKERKEELKNRKDELFKMFELYKSIGQMQMAGQCLLELQSLQQQPQQQPPVPAVAAAAGTGAAEDPGSIDPTSNGAGASVIDPFFAI